MQAVAALMGIMVIWWLTEAIRLPYTALLPIVVLPLLNIAGLSKNSVIEFSLISVVKNYFSPGQGSLTSLVCAIFWYMTR